MRRKKNIRTRKSAKQAKGEGRPSASLVFPIVGVGASAGGLQSFERLLKELPKSTGMAFVLVQHLDPTHASRLTEILSHSTTMPVAEARHGMRVLPNHVYVIPPNRSMFVKGRVLQLGPRLDKEARHLPIDFFFRSLAAEHKNRAIGVVLSGTATDGAAGMRVIKDEGGVTFAQDPRTAKYYGMPQNAIASGAVDFVLPPEEIAEYLIRIGNHSYMTLPARKDEPPELLPAAKEGGVAELFLLLKKSYGVDFRSYKSSTIGRRIRRRMALKTIESIPEYVKYARQEPDELRALFHDMFISVTEFFRQPGMFKQLGRIVFPALLKGRPPDAPIRIWVPGCSTGEEAYSIAITLLESLGNRASGTPIQIFGSDVNEEAIKRARVGRYGKAIAKNVSPARLKKFFTKVEGGYQVGKTVRDLCVFAKHDVLRDAPFSRLDLVSCRNLLIYLKPATHRKLIPLFHYTLKPSGFLILGSAETIGGFSNLFSQQDRKYKIYSRKPVSGRPAFDFPGGRLRELGVPEELSPSPIPRGDFDQVKDAADQLILNHYGPPAVLVGENMEILHFRGHTGSFLEPAPGVASLNLLKMAREGLLQALQTALQSARKTDSAVHRSGLHVDYEGRERIVNLHIVPLRALRPRNRTFLIVFEDVTPPEVDAEKLSPAPGQAAGRSRGADRVTHLKQELAATKAYLHSVIEGQEVANEELRSLNEEIQSTNEELQSTSEELETSNEELQSANEELNTLNEELQRRNQEVSGINNDLRNLLNGLNLTVIMLDRNLRIRRFTPAAQKALNLIPGDVGRPLSDIRLLADFPHLEDSVRDVMETTHPQVKDVQDPQGHWFSLQVLPYITTEGKVDGAIAALYDVDVLKRHDAELAELNDRLHEELTRRRRAEEEFQAIVESAPDAMVLSDERGRIVLMNVQAELLFGHQRADLIGQPFEVLLPERIRQKYTSQLLAPEPGPMVASLDLFGLRKDGSEFPIEVRLNPLRAGEATLVSSIVRDVSKQRARAKENQQVAVMDERSRMARDVHDTLAQGFAGVVLQLQAAEAAHEKRPAETLRHIVRARELALSNLEEARRSVLSLSGRQVETRGLARSLQGLLDRARAETSIRLQFTLLGTRRRLDAAIEENLLRIAQQALTNAIQHSRASEIRVGLEFKKASVHLEVADDGRGFVPSAVRGGFGLKSMRDRARQCGGKLDLVSEPGKGTRIAVAIRLRRSPAGDGPA
jgi:two-component system CheB/CheR fusion protein